MQKTLLGTAAFAAVMLSASGASAASYVVRAFENSSSGGTAVASLSFTSGQSFSVSVAAEDLWSAGALPRWSDADGLTGPRFATGTDESGEAAGTQIGADFGLHIQNGLSAPFGTLVGEIAGDFRVLGTSFNGTAWASGTLNLYYWDSNFGDNTQFVTAEVTAIPEPAAWAMMIGGFGLVGFGMRRRSRPLVSYN